MTTYWLQGEKQSYNPYGPSTSAAYVDTNQTEMNPSFTVQGPDSPASHSLVQHASPDQSHVVSKQPGNSTSGELHSERYRIKHEIATNVAKDLICNIENTVKELKRTQLSSLGGESSTSGAKTVPKDGNADDNCNNDGSSNKRKGKKSTSNNIATTTTRSGNAIITAVITPPYDTEFVINKGKVRETVKKFNQRSNEEAVANKTNPKPVKDED